MIIISVTSHTECYAERNIVSTALSNRELGIATALYEAGLSLPTATLAVVMAVREHARPIRELTDIVRQYQNLEAPGAVEQAVQELRKMKWLVEEESYGLYLVQQAANLRDLIETKLRMPGLANEMREMRSF